MPQSRGQLAELARRWITEGWQQGNPGMVDQLHALEFVDHDSSGRSPDRAGFKKGLSDLYAAFPDFHATVQDLVVDEKEAKVTVRWTARGTHRGSYINRPATGKVIRFKGIEIIRIQDGRIVERWGEWDGIDLLSQMTG